MQGSPVIDWSFDVMSDVAPSLEEIETAGSEVNKSKYEAEVKSDGGWGDSTHESTVSDLSLSDLSLEAPSAKNSIACLKSSKIARQPKTRPVTMNLVKIRQAVAGWTALSAETRAEASRLNQLRNWRKMAIYLSDKTRLSNQECYIIHGLLTRCEDLSVLVLDSLGSTEHTKIVNKAVFGWNSRSGDFSGDSRDTIREGWAEAPEEKMILA